MFALPKVGRFFERRPSPRRRWSTPLSFELLEDRSMPAPVHGGGSSIYTVTNTNSSGFGSLADAIVQVNQNNDTEIDFNIRNSDGTIATGVQTILVPGDLTLSRPAIINGFTESTFQSNITPGVLSIRLQGAGFGVNGLVVSSGVSGGTIEGIEFVGFNSTPATAGLVLNGSGTIVRGNDFGNIDNDIGPGASPPPPPNYANSIGIYAALLTGNSGGGGSSAGSNTIGGIGAGNVISGNSVAGILVSGESGNAILDNDIGAPSATA